MLGQTLCGTWTALCSSKPPVWQRGRCDNHNRPVEEGPHDKQRGTLFQPTVEEPRKSLTTRCRLCILRGVYKCDIARTVRQTGGPLRLGQAPRKMNKRYLSEFEQMVLLGLLRLGPQAYAVGVRQELRRLAGRRVTRGALYRTLDRLESKGYLEWQLEESAIPERGGHPMRCFQVTEAGIEALRQSRRTLLRLWDGLEAVLEEPK